VRAGILGTKALSLPSTFGAVLPDENLNSYADRGFELSLGYTKSYHHFSFNVSANVSYTRAKWLHYDEPVYTDPQDIRVLKQTGKWTDQMWGYKTDGLFTSQQDISSLPYDLDGNNNASIKVGDIKYVDINKLGKLNYQDEAVTGVQGNPKYMFGCNFNLKYDQFDMAGLLQGSAGRDISYALNINSAEGTTAFMYENMFTAQRQNFNAAYPLQDGSAYNTYPSQYWTKNASYLRLKDLSVGYNFTHFFKTRSGVSNLRLYVAGTNLITVSGLKKFGIDPEYIYTGNYPGAIYPKIKTLSVGANLSL
jgi:hypothetical protein